MEILALLTWLTSPIVYERPPEPEQIIIAEVTAYTNSIDETDSTPNITADGSRVYEGGVACPSYLDFGAKIVIKGTEYTCNDRMNKRYRDKHHFDIFMFSKKDALLFGRQQLPVYVVNEG